MSELEVLAYSAKTVLATFTRLQRWLRLSQ